MMKGEHESKKLEEPQSAHWSYKGKPLRVLSTSLGLALMANLLLAGAVHGEASTVGSATQPKLIEWSSDQVKKYYDPNIDWNIPLPSDLKSNNNGTSSNSGSNNNSSPDSGSSSNTTIINNNGGGFGGGGFGWTDLLLYHMIFNRGGFYSANSWYDRRPAYVVGTTRPYQPKTYSSDTFQNRPTVGSTVRPTTSKSSGTFSTKSSSSKASSSSQGGIGGKSRSFSSSSKSSSGSFGG